MSDFITENNYLDHAATTYVRPEVVEKMMPFFSEKFVILPVYMTLLRNQKMLLKRPEKLLLRY